MNLKENMGSRDKFEVAVMKLTGGKFPDGFDMDDCYKSMRRFYEEVGSKFMDDLAWLMFQSFLGGYLAGQFTLERKNNALN